jgi:hypothetical protein
LGVQHEISEGADVRFLSLMCPQCSRPLRLVSVLCSRDRTEAHAYPPVQTFECAVCEKDLIWQGVPATADYSRTRQARRGVDPDGRDVWRTTS